MTPALSMLLKEKEDEYYEKMIKRKIRKGELPTLQEFREQSEKSFYSKKDRLGSDVVAMEIIPEEDYSP